MLFAGITVGHAGHSLQNRETLNPYTEGIKSIGTVGTALQLVFLCLHQFLTALVFLSIVNSGRLYGDEQIRIIVAIDKHLMIGGKVGSD